jgi:small subunit ribosomal protein S4e
MIKEGSRGNKMVKKHLKALAAPVTWPVKRKGVKFILRPTPGKKFEFSMPIALVFKNLLKYCKTMKEVKSILQDKEILVGGTRTKEPKFLLGILDVLSLPVSGEYYRMLISKSRKLYLKSIPKEESNLKVSKIVGKTTLKGNLIQLNLDDSRNLLVKEDKYKVQDSLLLELPEQKIKAHYPMAEGSHVYIISGSHVGQQGKITSISKGLIMIKAKDSEFETPKESIIVVGKENVEMTLE